MNRRLRAGFTLVELLVVVSIIALLIAMLLPSLRKARNQAKQVVCGSHLKQISTALWNYWSEYNGRIPYVISPMTDGEATGDLAVPGFGDPDVADDEVDPFNRNEEETADEPKGWPLSVPNILMPTYLGSEEGVFVCPAAVIGWPRRHKPFRMNYRPAAVNQPNGYLPDPDQPDPSDLGPDDYDYEREFWGFLDGRQYKPPEPVHQEGKDMGSIMKAAQQAAFLRGVFMRDMAKLTEDGTGKVDFHGPHDGGVNVINKRLEVEFRNKKRTNEDLAPHGSGGGLRF